MVESFPKKAVPQVFMYVLKITRIAQDTKVVQTWKCLQDHAEFKLDIIKILEVSTLVFVHFILPNWCKNYLVYTTSPLMHYYIFLDKYFMGTYLPLSVVLWNSVFSRYWWQLSSGIYSFVLLPTGRTNLLEASFQYLRLIFHKLTSTNSSADVLSLQEVSQLR